MSKKLNCWMRYSDAGKLYRTCEEKETKMAKMIPQKELDKEFDEAREMIAKARALRRINEKRKEMSNAQRELAQMADADKESADLLLAKFATPVGQEEPSLFQRPKRINFGFDTPAPESPLKPWMVRDGWTREFSQRANRYYYFNKNDGTALWFPPSFQK